MSTNKVLNYIGSVILLLIVPGSLYISDYINKKWREEVITRQEQLSEQLIGYVDKESVEVEILSSFVSSTIITNVKGIIISATPAAANLFGYTPLEMRGMHINELMSERYRERHNEQFIRRIKEGYDPKKIVVIPQCYGLKKDRTEISIEVRTRVIKSDNGLILIARFTEIKNIKVIETNG